MTSFSLSSGPARLLRAPFALLLALALPVAAAEPVKKPFNLPADDAARSLKQFATQSGEQLLYSPSDVAGVRTLAVSGSLTAREALASMLEGTTLVVAQDRTTGALAVRTASPAEPKNALGRLADRAVAESEGSRVEDGLVKLERVEVVGSRIRSILGEQGANPVLVFTRAEIEQSGLTSLADLRQLVPQLSVGSTTAFDGNSSGSAPEGRLIFTLRGIAGNSTLVLVDGRRMARTGQRGATENYELTGLPLSAIERVEILLDGGSAVYGADAVGGVVNVVTRKNFSGTEVEYAYDNTFDTDAANKRISVSSSQRAGGLTVRTTLSYEDQNSLARADRWWLRSDDRRYLGGTDARSALFVGGVVRPVSGTLPGTGGATVLRIPANSSGRNLTVADFVAAGVPTDAERYDSGLTTNALNEYFRWSAVNSVEYRFRPWLTAFTSFNFSRSRSYADSGPVSLSTATNVVVPANSTTLPAAYPGNPFGVPINVQKIVWELGDLNRRYQMDAVTAVAGFRGDLPAEWDYEISVGYSRSNPVTLDQTFQFSGPLLGPAIQGPSPPVLLNNSLTFGAANPPGTLESFFLTGPNREIPESWTYDAKFDGPLFRWWGGEVGAAVGAEMREEYVEFRRAFFSSATESVEPTAARVVRSGFAEVAVPLVSPANRVRLVQQLQVSGALRLDSYNDFGDALKPRYGVSYRPASWLLLRATHGEAFKAPLLVDLTRPTSRQSQVFTATGTFVLFDTRRNEQVLGPVVNVTGGNPNLQPEESESRNYGVVLESPWRGLKGLSLSADWWDIRMSNRVGSVSFQDRLAFRPDLFLRDTPTAGDVAAGLPGRITEIDNRSINVGLFRTAGQDFSLRFHRAFGGWGDVTLRSTATRTTRYESITRPGLAPIATQSPLSRPTRVTSSFDWFRAGVGLGATATYQEGFRTVVTSATTETPSTIVWNFRLSYDFDQSRLWRPGGKWAPFFAGVRLNLGLLNALDLEPPLTSTGSTTGVIDPRLRRHTVTIRKSF